MLDKILILVLLTFIPALELRLSIPYGIYFLGIPASVVIPVCIISNIILGIVIYFLLEKIVNFFLRFNWFSKTYFATIERARKKIKKYVDRYGILGVALFIGIPLPGSGSYTGALGSYILGIKFRHFIIANLIGVIIAGTLVSLATLGTISIFG